VIARLPFSDTLKTMSFRFLTAGESHGPGLSAIVEGMPAGVPVVAEHIDVQLARRQRGYGRGGRMKIETDRAVISAGVRHGQTIGSPVALAVVNRDFESWQDVMSVAPLQQPYDADTPKRRPIEIPRPGHADYAGGLKYRQLSDMRNVLERASARETTMRVAVGAVARCLLESCAIHIGSHIVEIGGVRGDVGIVPPARDINAQADKSSVRCLDENATRQMEARIDAARDAGDTVGGVFEVVADGIPVGLGSHVHWDRKLDGRLAQALMSIHAMKGVEIGLGFEAARRGGSEVHDSFGTDGMDGMDGNAAASNGSPNGALSRPTNNAGGLEGGVTNGSPLVCRVAMKPIATLMNALPSVNMTTGEATGAHVERSDYCAVPAAGVVGEAMVAIVLADALLEKFGGDSLEELRESLSRHRDYSARLGQPLPPAVV
jgi:chorismate synthase